MSNIAASSSQKVGCHVLSLVIFNSGLQDKKTVELQGDRVGFLFFFLIFFLTLIRG